jgi:hypothetical protein
MQANRPSRTRTRPRTSRAFARKLFELYGGRRGINAWLRRTERRFDAKWNQNIDRIGRVLRAHLVVEHYIGERLVAGNPNLGSLEDARLSYAQKLDLMDPEDRVVKLLLPALRRLGAIRNRLAHRLSIDLTDDDRQAFFKNEIFFAYRKALVDRCPEVSNKNPDDTVTIIEDFAQYAARLLAPNQDQHIWDEALWTNGPPRRAQRSGRGKGASPRDSKR